MVVANELMGLMPITVSEGVNGKRVTEISKDGNNDFMRSVIGSDPEARDLKEPFFVLDLGVVEFLMDKWTRSLPTIRPFYAVKCNPDPAFVCYLANIGANFDCASQAEIEQVISHGVSPDRIIFANPCKPESHIRFAAKAGVKRTTFDSVYEVEKIRRCYPECELLIRIKAPDDDSARCPLGAKYGALPHEVEPLLQAAKTAGIAVVGVSFHVGSGATDWRAYHSAMAAAGEVFKTAVRLGLPKMSVLNIGGGFTAGPQFEDAAEAVKYAVNAYFQDEPGLEIIAEPGRFFAEWPFTLAVNVIGKRVRGELREYYINDGVYGSLNCILNDHAIVTMQPLDLDLELESGIQNEVISGSMTYPSTVFGPTCDALDTVARDYQLPEMEVGDWLVFPKLGAYSSACGANFNGFKGVGISTHLVHSKYC